MNRHRFSGVTATIILIFVLSFFVDRTIFLIPLSLGNFSLSIRVKTIDLTTPAAALMAAIGAYGIIAEKKDAFQRATLIHTILPFSIVLTMGISLRNAARDLSWWMMLFVFGAILYLSLISEFANSEPNSSRKTLANIGVTALCNVSFFLIMGAVRANITRLILELALISIPTFFLGFRIYAIHLNLSKPTLHAFILTIACLQLSAALHYWPIDALSYSLLMFLWFYLFSSIECSLSDGKTFQESVKRRIPDIICLLLLLLLRY